MIVKILTYLGLQARAPPRSPARMQALQAARRPRLLGAAAPEAFKTEAKRPDGQGKPIYDLFTGRSRSDSLARSGPLSTLKVAISASRAGSGRQCELVGPAKPVTRNPLFLNEVLDISDGQIPRVSI